MRVFGGAQSTHGKQRVGEVVEEVDVGGDHAVSQSVAGGGELCGHTGVHTVVIPGVGVQLVAQECGQELVVGDFLRAHRNQR